MRAFYDRRNHAGPVKSLHDDTIFRPSYIGQAEPRTLRLGARRIGDAVKIRAQEASCKFDHGIAEIHDTKAGDWADILPSCGVTFRRDDLQSTQFVEQEGDGAEISMWHNRGTMITCGLGWVF